MSARKGWTVLITVGRETPESQPREKGRDEEYLEREYVKVLRFPSSADRVVREIEATLKAGGFVQRGYTIKAGQDAPR